MSNSGTGPISPVSEPLAATYISFEGYRCLASGSLEEVACKTKEAIDRGGHEPIVVLDAQTSEPVEIDMRGSVEDVIERLKAVQAASPAPGEKRGPGRPKLGVAAREVTLLPRHWEWLDTQPGGASAALRRLVEEAKRANRGKDRARRAQEAVYRFLSAMAGNLPHFEEALRAFYRGERERFGELVEGWPSDVREQARKLVALTAGAVDA